MKNDIYSIEIEKINNEKILFEKYRGKVVLIVNTASSCGLTPQFDDLEKLYQKNKDRGLEILGFPCNQFANQEKLEGNEIVEFCKMNFGVTFEIFKKIYVNGNSASELYKYLKSKKKGFIFSAIKWNFTKFLVDREGNVVARFEPTNITGIQKELDKIL